MDQHKLRSLVFDKTGVKVDIDDPIFALVALNEAVLEEAVERHVRRIDAASHELAQRARHTGGLPPSSTGPAPVDDKHRAIAAAAGAAILGALLVLLGQALFFRPAPAAPVTVVPAPLTAAQVEAIATGEKITRALPKLDARTRSAVLAEMNKP